MLTRICNKNCYSLLVGMQNGTDTVEDHLVASYKTKHTLKISSVQLLSHIWLFVTHALQHARLPCPSPIPGACTNSCLLSRWCHPTILSSVIPFSSCLQSFPASASFPMTTQGFFQKLSALSVCQRCPCGAWPKEGAILFGSYMCHPRNNPGYTIWAFHIILFIKLCFSLMIL